MAHLNVSVSSGDDVEEVGNKSDRMDTESEREDLRDELDKSYQPGPEEGESEEEYSDEQGEDSLSERVNLNEEVAIELTDQEESPSEAEDDGLVTPKRKVKDPAPIWMCTRRSSNLVQGIRQVLLAMYKGSIPIVKKLKKWIEFLL